MVRIWLLRHGETDSNRDGVFQGQIDTPLNANGKSQAAATAARLSAVNFQRIFSSDLLRAVETAEPVAAGRRVCVDTDRDLREMHYGILQGRRYSEAGELLAMRGLGPIWESREFDNRGVAPPGGESCRQVCNRARRFLRRIDGESREAEIDDVLVVAHGGLLRIMLTELLGLPLSQRKRFAFSNCGLSRVRRSTPTSLLELHNAILWDEQTLHVNL